MDFILKESLMVVEARPILDIHKMRQIDFGGLVSWQRLSNFSVQNEYLGSY